MKTEDDNIGNLHFADNAKIKNEVDKAIRLIKSNSGYGQIIMSIYDSKVVNIKVTLSSDLK